MKYYLKLFLLSTAIGFINILLFLYLLQFKTIHNSSYISVELGIIFLILLSILLQFLILLVISFLFKRNLIALVTTSVLFIVICSVILFMTYSDDTEQFRSNKNFKPTESYDYLQGISTPEGYPIKLLIGSGFNIPADQDRKSNYFLESNKVYSSEWGVGNTTFISYNRSHAAPSSLRLYWYSYLENKYYLLNTNIDSSKISNSFKKGFKRDVKGTLTNKESIIANYNALITGIAPGGDVVLWMSGSVANTEIGFYKANEINSKEIKDYDIVTDNERKTVLNDTCACIDRSQFRKIVNEGKPIPFGIWTNKYRKKFNWKLTINDFGQTKSALNFYFFNGENYALYNEDVIRLNYQNQVLPSLIKFTFIKDKLKYVVFIEFDENEIFNNFEKLTKINKDEPIDVVLNIASDLKQAKIELKSKDKTLYFEALKKLKINPK